MTTRRSFLAVAPVVVALPAFAQLKKEDQEEVAVAEDLMREHGVLKRVLLIYDELAQRIHDKKDFPPAVVADSARIIRTFIEDYHEKLEEDYLFPRFRKANKLVDLVEVLTRQHQAGRALTAQVTALASQGLKSEPDRDKLSVALRQFVRMYAPHEAREDTVLFPALHQILSRNEFDSLGEEFEDKEHQLFGQEGFENMVDRVAGLEKQLGIYDLAQFTPSSAGAKPAK
jgi:hemerythrin-like domain-containing protein